MGTDGITAAFDDGAKHRADPGHVLHLDDVTPAWTR
jgi:hypothetical protein